MRQNLPHNLCDLSSLPLHENSINYFWIMYYIPLSNVRKKARYKFVNADWDLRQDFGIDGDALPEM